MEVTEQIKTQEELTHQSVIEFLPEMQKIDCDMLEWAYNQGYRENRFEVHEIGGQRYTNGKHLERIPDYEPEFPNTFDAFTLGGLCDWIRKDVDSNFAKYKQLIVRVTNSSTVEVFSPTCGLENNRRARLAKCVYAEQYFPWGEYLDVDRFVTFILSRFVDDTNMRGVGELVGNIRQENSAETADDGISQRVTTKSGVARLSTTTIKNPVYLAPKRTFCEIEQPVSPFVLRIQDGPCAALFEADAGEWKNVAVARLKKYLETAIGDLNVVIIA